ncbi:MAG: hypothetical protein HYZ29_00505 [Myxococcales bacterium]|nr:hypothetical protein [Myxococcales bacterium]
MSRIFAFAALGVLACSASSEPATRVASAPHAPAPAPTAAAPTASTASTAPAALAPPTTPSLPPPSHAQVVQRIAQMVHDPNVRQRASRRGLDVVNVAWEDTGRAWGSALGPNISDVTLQVRYRDGDGRVERTALMPVVRFPNFTDRTADVKRSRLFVRAGNHKPSGKIDSVPLGDVLRNLRGFLSRPGSLLGSGSFLAARDTHFLVAAQAVFLPIPAQGAAEFNPVVFNYQSAPGSPAVLTLLVSRQGTSISVIENKPEETAIAGRGQELYFNAAGQRAPFRAERRSEVEARIQAQGGPKTDDERSALARGADVMFLIQVPLVHKHRGVLGGSMWGSGVGYGYGGLGLSGSGQGGGGVGLGSIGTLGHGAGTSDVERAVIGHGAKRGPFAEGAGLKLERDARSPVRVTVQFYKATSNGVVTDADLDAIAKNIGSVYEHADFVGSLVVPEGAPRRPTAWQRVPGEWFPW